MTAIPSWDDVRKLIGPGEMTGNEIATRLGAMPHRVGEVIASMWIGGVLERTDHSGPASEADSINAARTTWRLCDAERLAYALEHADG